MYGAWAHSAKTGVGVHWFARCPMVMPRSALAVDRYIRVSAPPIRSDAAAASCLVVRSRRDTSSDAGGSPRQHLCFRSPRLEVEHLVVERVTLCPVWIRGRFVPDYPCPSHGALQSEALKEVRNRQGRWAYRDSGVCFLDRGRHGRAHVSSRHRSTSPRRQTTGGAERLRRCRESGRRLNWLTRCFVTPEDRRQSASRR